ncbi:MAG: hypothetical protein LBT11_02675 [Treponema sp.]|jgi:hypothetical protein|nr:hypothetical protein [Treponema sp.]
MMQFYFLSILLNAVTGFILVTDKDREEPDTLASFRLDPSNGNFRFVLGLLTAVMGLLRLLSSTDVPVVGDIIPALAGLASGFSLIFDFYRSKTTLPSERVEKTGEFFQKNKRWLGFTAIGAALLHFLFPGLLLL